MNERKIVSIDEAKPKATKESKFKAGQTVYLIDTPPEFNHFKVRYADKDGVTFFWLNDVGDGGEMMLVDEMLTLDPPVTPKRKRKPKDIEITFTPEFDK